MPSTSPRKFNFPGLIPSPLHQESPRNNTPIVKRREKDYSLWLDGKDAERFIREVEKIAEIKVASGRDIEIQIEFWTKDKDITYHVEGIPGYERAY
ncbi:hypothetical protein O181_067985 [Austropuccinia psidii MF-1]|uniref:Uncharacterized protein n=1 Tax=Austropuccinia psidii MF-1 TaxID=1389203 RepID=A0A9Q3ERS2_9BASI|nr:hypothetical protein [Austropuccinia psidii MF-1]